MPAGYSLHIGVNTVNKTHYPDLNDLRGAVNDAEAFNKVARDYFGYKSSKILLNEEATSTAVLSQLSHLASKTNTGDIVFITYSGHGGQVENPNWKEKGQDEETDETWCLHDRQLIDDELFEAFRKFKKGVRIVIISDSCHSGSVIRNLDGNNESKESKLVQNFLIENGFKSKELEKHQAADIYFNNLSVYEPIQNQFRSTRTRENIEASVKLFAACQDHQVAYDGEKNGRFTETILHIIETGKWKDFNSPHEFISILKNQFHYPNPNLFQYGKLIPAFENNFPLVIDIDNANYME